MNLQKTSLIYRRRPVFLAAAWAALVCCRPCVAASVTLAGSAVETTKHQITLDATALPAQLVIKADAAELPLPLRGAPPAEAELQAFGRGPQLRAPARLEATIEGKVITAVAVKPAQPAMAGDAAEAKADLRADALPLAVSLRVTDDGALAGSVTYGGVDLTVEKLELVLDLAGTVDTVVLGAPLAEAGKAYPPGLTDIGTAEGVAWKNVNPGGVVNRPGVPAHLFIGSGDRGFTWLASETKGFATDPQVPTMVVMRDAAGLLTWRIALVNTPTRVKEARTARFTLLLHPARAAAADRRRLSWTPWAGEAAVLPLDAAARKPGTDLVRADAATVHEAFAGRALLAGPAGGDAASAAATLADTYPLGLFRYLAARHTALPVQLRPNAAALATPGASPANDRMALGRALLHDAGVDIGGLGQKVAAANLMRALDAFGFFADDGLTEFLPYWRSGGIVRYGEAFVSGGAFEVSEANPMDRVYVSVYLRPDKKDPSKRTAVFVVVNEGDAPVREQFYLLKPERLFGGPNKVTTRAIIERWDFSRIPEDSDWRKGVMVGSSTAYEGGQNPAAVPQLMDIEDSGYVRAKTVTGGMEIYGFLFVPARGFRVLLGAGAF